MVSFPYYSHTTPIRIPKDMGMVWEPYHKGVPLLGVPGITLDNFVAQTQTPMAPLNSPNLHLQLKPSQGLGRSPWHNMWWLLGEIAPLFRFFWGGDEPTGGKEMIAFCLNKFQILNQFQFNPFYLKWIKEVFSPKNSSVPYCCLNVFRYQFLVWYCQFHPSTTLDVQDSLLGDSSSTEAKKALERDLKAKRAGVKFFGPVFFLGGKSCLNWLAWLNYLMQDFHVYRLYREFRKETFAM